MQLLQLGMLLVALTVPTVYYKKKDLQRRFSFVFKSLKNFSKDLEKLYFRQQPSLYKGRKCFRECFKRVLGRKTLYLVTLIIFVT